MRRIKMLIGAVGLAMLAAMAGGCGHGSVGYYDPYWDPYYFPWHYSDWGAWTVVHRPVGVVDSWTRGTFMRPSYRGYMIQRHNSPQITYTATQGDHTYQVVLTQRNDSTQVEVRARNGADQWQREQARNLMGQILADYRADRPTQ